MSTTARRPRRGLQSWGRWAYLVGSGLFQVTVAAALVVGLGYWLRVLEAADPYPTDVGRARADEVLPKRVRRPARRDDV